MGQCIRLIMSTFLLCFAMATQAIGQTSEGRDFWFSFGPNFSTYEIEAFIGGGNLNWDVFIHSREKALVSIHIFGTGETRDLVIEANLVHRERLFSITSPNGAGNSVGPIVASDEISAKGVHITSDVDISVSIQNDGLGSTDATLILPTHSLGKKYYVSSYRDTIAPRISGPSHLGSNAYPQAWVVATKDSTKIEVITPVPTSVIFPGANANGTDSTAFYPAGYTHSVMLNRGEVYSIPSDTGWSGFDLTGTSIESLDECKPIAVFGGSGEDVVTGGQDCRADGSDPSGQLDLYYPYGYSGSQLFSQMFPVKAWGKKYISIPFSSRSGYVLQTTASFDNTRVKIGNRDFTLKAGQYIRTRHSEPMVISSDKPIQVAQLSQSISCDFPPESVVTGPKTNKTGKGSPFMMMLNPQEQMAQYGSITTLHDDTFDQFVTVLSKTGDIQSFSIVGRTHRAGNAINHFPDVNFQSLPDNPDVSYATIALENNNSYTLIGKGFNAYAYANWYSDAYGYLVAAGTRNLLAEIILSNDDLGIIDDQACANSKINFEVVFDNYGDPEPRFTDFQWDFGDGNVGTGQMTSHTYAKAGDYKITLVASKGDGDCRTEEIFHRNIEISPFGIYEIIGSQSVCPNVSGVEYYVEGHGGNDYNWIVEGGNIARISNDQQRIWVDWSITNSHASVNVVESNTLGCQGDTLTLNILINEKLEPASPKPVDNTFNEVCFQNQASVHYFTPLTPGSEYLWGVEGGSFIGENTGNEVTISWDGVGLGKLWYRENNPTLDFCEGVSDTLEVVVLEDIKVNSLISNLSCFESEDGAISLNVSGGKGPYTAIWDNGQNGLNLTSLAAGNYSGKVYDAVGCSQTYSIQITQPDSLTTEIITEPTLCYQEENGTATLVIKGGTAPYRVFWDNAPTAGDLTNSKLSSGPHTVRILDAHDCEMTLNFDITQPEPLFATTTDSPSCPNDQTGTIYVEASGGTPPYVYRWNTNPPQDSQLIRGLPAGTYSVTVMDRNGCTFTFNDKEIREKYPRIQMPNAFSPNGDGFNDHFRAVYECTTSFQMKVFSKWGEIIFYSDDIDVGWDGLFRGSEVGNGTYSYLISYTTEVNGQPFSEVVRGTIRLLR